MLIGAAFVLGSSVSYAFYQAGSEPVIRRLGAARFTALAMLVSAVATLLHFAVSQPLQALAQPGAGVPARGGHGGVFYRAAGVHDLGRHSAHRRGAHRAHRHAGAHAHHLLRLLAAGRAHVGVANDGGGAGAGGCCSFSRRKV